MSGAGVIDCPYCEGRHDDRYLCDPARKVLGALHDRGMRFGLPTVEFPEPIGDPAMLGDDLVLCASLVAKAAIVPCAGVPFPALVLTGTDIAGAVLPSWVMPGDGSDLRRVAKLITDITEMAIRRAREAKTS